jgi:hypothetical protein
MTHRYRVHTVLKLNPFSNRVRMRESSHKMPFRYLRMCQNVSRMPQGGSECLKAPWSATLMHEDVSGCLRVP